MNDKMTAAQIAAEEAQAEYLEKCEAFYEDFMYWVD